MPPHSVEAEQAVIGGLLLDNRAWEDVADRIMESDFYRNDHRIIFLRGDICRRELLVEIEAACTI